MASIPKIGTKIASGSKFKKLGIAAGLLAAAGVGAARQDPVQYTMNATQEAMFGTDQIDNMVLGTDVTARNFVGIPFDFKSSVSGGAAGGAVLGAGIGGVLGRGSKIGGLLGGTIGAGLGSLLGGYAGFVNSDVGRVLMPRENPANMFSRRSLNTSAFNFQKVDLDKAESILQNAAEYPYAESGDGIRGYSQMPGSTFPRRMATRSWDSASGDIVLGSYNLRRG